VASETTRTASGRSTHYISWGMLQIEGHVLQAEGHVRLRDSSRSARRGRGSASIGMSTVEAKGWSSRTDGDMLATRDNDRGPSMMSIFLIRPPPFTSRGKRKIEYELLERHTLSMSFVGRNSSSAFQNTARPLL